MADEPTEIEALFEKLHSFIRNNQHKKALKAAEDILKLSPKDEDAARCRLAAFMQLAEWQNAYDALSKAPLAGQCAFEKAYCLYRLGRIEESLEACQALPEEQAPARLQLEAQLRYRMGHNRECIQLYDQLFQQHKVDSLELKTNVIAAYVAAQLSHEIPDIMAAMKVSSKQSFELGFNKACGLLEAGELGGAETELRMALKLGRETLFEEDYGEEEVEEELAPLTVQLAHVLARAGRGPEAVELLEGLFKGGSLEGDEATRAVALNNLSTEASQADNHSKKSVASALKKLEGMVDKDSKGSRLLPGLEAKLSPGQRAALHLNRALLYLLAGRLDACREALAGLSKAGVAAVGGPAGMLRLLLLQAAAAAKDGKTFEADQALEAAASQAQALASSAGPRPPERGLLLAPLLMRVQLALEGGQPGKALELLGGLGQQDQGVAMAGAVLATRLALLEQLGDQAGAEAVLEAGRSYWAGQGGAKDPAAGPALAWCLGQLVSLRLRLGKLQEAIAAYQQLQATGIKTAATTGVLARLTRAMALADPTAAPRMQAQVPPGTEPRGLDADALEAGSLAPGAKERQEAMRAKRAAQDMEVDAQPKVKKPKKRKHKPRYPKGFNPEAGPHGGLPPPDPERWLPKWQRADFKKRKTTSSKRREGKDAVKGSQGAGKVDEQLDRSSAPAPAKAEPAKASAKPTLPPRKGKGKK